MWKCYCRCSYNLNALSVCWRHEHLHKYKNESCSLDAILNKTKTGNPHGEPVFYYLWANIGFSAKCNESWLKSSFCVLFITCRSVYLLMVSVLLFILYVYSTLCTIAMGDSVYTFLIIHSYAFTQLRRGVTICLDTEKRNRIDSRFMLNKSRRRNIYLTVL